MAYILLDPPEEFTLAALNIAADILLTAMGCFVIKKLPKSSDGIYLLVGMLLLTLTVAILRITLYGIVMAFEYNPNGSSAATALQSAFIFLADFEVIASIIVSCIPGVKVWYRGFWPRARGTMPIATTSGFNNTGMLSDMQKSGSDVENITV